MESRRGRRSILLLLMPVLALQGQAGPNVYGTAPWPDPRLVVVPGDEMAFTSGRFASEKQESVFLMCRFNDGWVFMASMFMSDAWFFDRWGIYALVTDPAGRTWWSTAEIPKRNVRTAADRLSVTDGNNTVESDGRRLRVRFRLTGFSCDLTFDNLLPPWKAGNGTVPLTADGAALERWVMLSPWAKVEGSMTLDGNAVPVRGQGYADRNLFVGPLGKTNSRYHSLRLFSPETVPDRERWGLMLLDAVSHRDFGFRRIPVLLFARGGQWVFSSHSYRLQPGPMRPTEGSAAGYPGSVHIGAREAGYSLEGEFSTRILFNKTDVFADMPPLVAAVLRLLFRRPVFFRTLGDFRGKLVHPDGTETELELEGAYEYVAIE